MRYDDLEYTVKEADYVSRLLEKIGIEVTVLLDEEATIRNVLKELKRRYAVFHFTGHASFKTRALREESGVIRLYDGSLNIGKLEKAMNKEGAPSLSFVNACDTGREKYRFETWEPLGMANAFMDCGTDVFIGAFWAIDDEVSQITSSQFYKGLSKGKSVGKSLRNARNWCRKRKPKASIDTWPAYVMYGNPMYHLSDVLRL